jgi:ATP-dependent Lhr-like helicase
VQSADGRPLGTLSQDFVDGLVDGVSCFLLGGRAWLVNITNHSERTVQVASAPRGRQPTWGGFLPQFLGYELCQKILEILCSGESYPYLDAQSASELTQRRQQLQGIISPRVGGIDFSGDEITWYTFAGGRINATIRHALADLCPTWQILPDNFRLRIRADNLAPAEFNNTLNQLRQPDFWTDKPRWLRIAGNLPNYRLSKFQPLMPANVQSELVATFMLNVDGAMALSSNAS